MTGALANSKKLREREREIVQRLTHFRLIGQKWGRSKIFLVKWGS